MSKPDQLLKPEETITPAKMQLVYTNDNLPKGLNVNSVLTEKEVSIHFNWKNRTLSNYRQYYQQSGGKIRVGPKFNIETPKNGVARRIAGTIPIKVLIKAVKVSAVMISLIFKGETNKFVKFLLQISSRNNILKLILDLNRKS